MSRAHVYIVAEWDGPRKIGISDKPADRMLALRAGRAPLSIIATYPREGGDAALVEQVAHWLLREKSLGGEWFDVGDAEAVAAVGEAIALVDSGDWPMALKHTTNLRKVGGSIMLAVPPAILDLLHLQAGATVGVAIDNGRMVVDPAPRPRYTMAELLAISDYTQPQPAAEREWVDAPAAGREIM
jgi:antitoxin ChpS